MFKIFETQFTPSEIWDIENSFYNNSERFGFLRDAGRLNWVKLTEFVIYPNLTKSFDITNPMNKKSVMLDSKEFGIFISIMTLNKFCWDYEYNVDKCEFMCDLYYTSYNFILNDFKKSVVLDLLC